MGPPASRSTRVPLSLQEHPTGGAVTEGGRARRMEGHLPCCCRLSQAVLMLLKQY